MAGSGAMNTLGINHATVVVDDLGTARRRYMDVFGAVFFREGAPSRLAEEHYDYNLFYVGNLMIESIAPHKKPDDTVLQRFVARYGYGYHFFHFGVESLDAAREELLSRGYELVTQNRFAITTHPRSTHGLMLGAAEGFMNPPWDATWVNGNAAGLRGLRSVNFVVPYAEAAAQHLTEVWGGTLVGQQRTDGANPTSTYYISFGPKDLGSVRGPHVVGLVQPLTEEGSVADFLRKRQPRAYSITWSVEDIAGTKSFLNDRAIDFAETSLHGEGITISPDQMFGAVHEFSDRGVI